MHYYKKFYHINVFEKDSNYEIDYSTLRGSLFFLKELFYLIL
jgi:hypothetical protein